MSVRCFLSSQIKTINFGMRDRDKLLAYLFHFVSEKGRNRKMFLVLSEPPSIVMNFTEFILGTNPTDFDDDDDESSDDEDHVHVGLEQLESDVVEPIQPNVIGKLQNWV
jgi:hypothetical protein